MSRGTTARAVAALGAAAVMSVSACSTNREVTRPDPVPITDKLVSGAVLTTDDLPDGWTDVDKPAPLATDVITGHACDDRLTELEPKESATVAFSQSGGALLSNTIAWFPGNGGAVDQLLRDIEEDCRQVVLTDESLAIRTGPLDFGALSDDTLPLKFELEPVTGPIRETDLILIREGDLVSLLRLDGLRPSDKALLDQAVRTSIGRLAIIAQQAEGA